MHYCESSSFFNCSYVIKNIIFHGPILNQVGTKPLYKAKNPSFLKVYKNNKIHIIIKKNKKNMHTFYMYMFDI